MKQTKLIASLGLIAAVSSIAFIGCGANNNTPVDGIVVRKIVGDELDPNTPNTYQVWVKYEKDGQSNVISYDVTQDYFNKVKDGDTFNPEYKTSEGKTEYSIDV